MFGYAINGKPIIATMEQCPGSATLVPGSLVMKNGLLEHQYEGSTTFDYDAQRTVMEGGEHIFYDDDFNEWPACSIILLPEALGTIDDAEAENFGKPAPLPADLLAEATAAYETWLATKQGASEVRYSIAIPKGGLRLVESFTAEEKKRLRPIAETLALLDGNAFFGATRDDSGDDTFYEQYLPEAAALAAANGGWSEMTSFARGDTPLPHNIFNGFLQTDEPAIVMLSASEPNVRVSITGIEWDLANEDGEACDVKLPTDLEVQAPMDWADEGRLADLLADHFGFCVKGLGEARPVD